MGLLLLLNSQSAGALATRSPEANVAGSAARQRLSLNAGWRFSKFTSNPDSLSYSTMKQWILPSGNDFIGGTSAQHQRPSGVEPGSTVQYVQSSFDDSSWEAVNLPHDWAIKGPFGTPGVSGGMGRLPSPGIAWYRRNVTMAAGDMGKKSYFLDIDGAQSYAMVWLNGHLVGGWPYGYASFRLDLTPYMSAGDGNVLAIRLDNPTDGSRWYPGGGIYRNVWLVVVDTTHISKSGTYITTPSISKDSATLNLMVALENKGTSSRDVAVQTNVYVYDPATKQAGADVVATFASATATVAAGGKVSVNGSATVSNPRYVSIFRSVLVFTRVETCCYQRKIHL